MIHTQIFRPFLGSFLSLTFQGRQFSPHLGCGVVSLGWPSATPIFFPTTSGWFELSHLKNLHQIELRNPNWRQVKIPKNDWKAAPRWCLIPSLLPFWFAFKLYSFQSLLRYPRNPTGKLHSSLPAECLGIFYHNPVRSLPNLSPVNGLIFGVASSKKQKGCPDFKHPKRVKSSSCVLNDSMTLAFLASINITIFFSFWYINPWSHVFANHLRNRLGHKDVVLGLFRAKRLTLVPGKSTNFLHVTRVVVSFRPLSRIDLVINGL